MWELPMTLIFGAIVAGKIILVVLIWLAWRAHRSKAGVRNSRMVGLKGRAVTEVSAEGRVMVMGEYWWARSRTKIAEGEMVRVVAREGLTLEVEIYTEKAKIPKRVSAVPRRRGTTDLEPPHQNDKGHRPGADRRKG
jgi:membrane-bound ClpP family serine protease